VLGPQARRGVLAPSHAIAGADLDHNDATAFEANWAPLVPNPELLRLRERPRLPDRPGRGGHPTHARRGRPARAHLGELPDPRTYPHLSELEYDAFHARIWSGLHFRKAMVDGYDIAHRTAERVMSTFGA
jgi:hypothetical protein